MTIVDDDRAGVTVTPTAVSVNEGSSATYTVKLNTAPTGNVVVAVAGAADDVSVAGAPVTFNAANYDIPQTVTVSAAEDEDLAADEVVTLTHTASGGGYNAVTIDAVTVTVTETTPVVQLLTDPATVTEGTDISLTVTASEALTGTLPVSLTLADRDDSGFDADDIPGPLTRTSAADFGATPSLTGTVTIPTRADTDEDEGTETYTITLNDGLAYDVGRDSTAEGALNDGAAPTPGVTVTPTALTVAEGSSATYTVKLEAAPTGNVTVTVGNASGDVAVAGSPLTFTTANYDTPQTVTVTAAADDDATADPAVTLTHSASGGGYNGVTIDPVVVTVTETTPVLQLLNNPATVREGAAGQLDGHLGQGAHGQAAGEPHPGGSGRQWFWRGRPARFPGAAHLCCRLRRHAQPDGHGADSHPRGPGRPGGRRDLHRHPERRRRLRAGRGHDG